MDKIKNWWSKKSKKQKWIIVIVTIFILGAIGNQNNSNVKNSKKTSNNLVGQTFSLDAYHNIKFKTKTRYWIYQNPLNCGGEGNWSIENNNIILGPNDSNCESTRAKKGSYNLNKF